MQVWNEYLVNYEVPVDMEGDEGDLDQMQEVIEEMHFAGFYGDLV